MICDYRLLCKSLQLLKLAGLFVKSPHINKSSEISNSNITFKSNNGGTCKTQGVVYAARCKRHKKLNIGQTGETLAAPFSKHRYDIKNRPDNTELSIHFHSDHKLEDELEAMTLRANLNTKPEQLFYENYWICRLQTLQPSGINADGGTFVKEMYSIIAK